MQELLLIGRLFYLESASRESSSTSGVVNVRRAAAVINKIDSGRCKLVRRAFVILNSKGGKINLSVQPLFTGFK